MIIEYTPDVGGFGSRFHMGEATLILYLGHGEYGIPDNSAVTVEAWDPYTSETDTDDAPKPQWLQDNLHKLQDHELFTEALGEPNSGPWGTIIQLSGPLHSLWKTFYLFSNQLDPEQDPADYTPGGDDDTYDYYPSGFECMEQWARDLDEMDALWEAAVKIAAAGWVEHMRHFAEHAKHSFTARHRIESIVANLLVAKGPFKDWEFEHHAAPYLPTVNQF